MSLRADYAKKLLTLPASATSFREADEVVDRPTIDGPLQVREGRTLMSLTRRVVYFAMVLSTTFGMVAIPASASTNPSFTSSFSFSVHLEGQTSFTVRGDGRVSLVVRGTSGPTRAVTMSLARQTCGILGLRLERR